MQYRTKWHTFLGSLLVILAGGLALVGCGADNLPPPTPALPAEQTARMATAIAEAPVHSPMPTHPPVEEEEPSPTPEPAAPDPTTPPQPVDPTPSPQPSPVPDTPMPPTNTPLLDDPTPTPPFEFGPTSTPADQGTEGEDGSEQPTPPPPTPTPPPPSPTADEDNAGAVPIEPQPPTSEPALPEQPAELTDEDIVAQRLASLEPGILAFDPPERMTAGETEQIEVRITREIPGTGAVDNPAFAEPARALTETLEGDGDPRLEDLPVSTYMRVRLTGRNFAIEPLEDEDQLVGETDFTRWVWNVTALRSGEHTLQLVATARIRVRDYQETKNLVVKAVEIPVSVNPGYSLGIFLRSYGAVLLVCMTILGASLLFVWKQKPELLLRNPEAQLANAHDKLNLILERKAQYVLEEDIPLQLIRNERSLKQRIAELEAKVNRK